MSRVLAVDDEAAILRFVQNALTQFGYTVTTADSAVAALQHFEREGAFDLLLTDFMMPGMRGDELANEVRKRQPGLKIVYLTGFTDALHTAHPQFTPNETALAKPVTLADLHDAVSLAIYGHRGGPPKP
jgi:two-component system cell cycle sensor histidine kinase/response regulator CckA